MYRIHSSFTHAGRVVRLCGLIMGGCAGGACDHSNDAACKLTLLQGTHALFLRFPPKNFPTEHNDHLLLLCSLVSGALTTPGYDMDCANVSMCDVQRWLLC